jgi:RNA 2',3'-cyclic 3'-phosphodiesterase
VNDATQVWRVFCAVELPHEVHARLEAYIIQLREKMPDVALSWSRVQNIHLTLKFFGNVEIDRVPAISAAVSRAAQVFSSFHINVENTGVFPGPGRPQVFWIGVTDQSGKLVALQNRLDEECAGEGFPKEDRAYRPHLTIARVRKSRRMKWLGDPHLRMQFAPAEVEVKELVVFRSELSSKGSHYTPISHHPLPNP